MRKEIISLADFYFNPAERLLNALTGLSVYKIYRPFEKQQPPNGGQITFIYSTFNKSVYGF